MRYPSTSASTAAVLLSSAGFGIRTNHSLHGVHDSAVDPRRGIHDVYYGIRCWQDLGQLRLRCERLRQHCISPPSTSS